MRELCFKLFEKSHFNTGIAITPFSLPHIVFIVLIAGSIVALWLSAKGKSTESKQKVLRLLAYSLVASYLSDFFVHEFVYDGLNTDKLPFHICTVLCPLVAISQFNLKGDKIREPIAILAILAPLMYLCYPANIGSGEPWCYQAVQTMFYHGVLLAWGVLTVAFGLIDAQIKNAWKCGVLLVVITLWAKLGNILLEHNWFFLEEDALYIGLVEGGIIPKWSLMIINPIVFFLAVLFIYGLIYAVRSVIKKRTVVIA